ncbi:unnamed protein product [Prorocentrum cordatum]|uniref:EF-hand domain-containing protein n=1 Tax=Prorocentrum cordatum TaxID=2364126 RepID=A0ABN9X364_9DINO|nr:unnamed protein product [Polarella glacialis]
MGYVLALLDTDGDGHVDKEEIAYAARLILHDKQREIADLPHKIAQQEHKEHRWNMFFSVSILICAGSTTWSYAAFGEDMKLLLAFVPSLLLVMFCFVQLIRQRALLSRLRKRKHDSKMFIQHLKGGGSEPWPLQPARDAARDVARLQEPFLPR